LTPESNGERKSKRNEYEEKLMALHRHASQLSSATNVDDIAKHTLDAMEFILGFSSADFSLVDTEKRCLRFKGKRGTSPSFSELPLDGPGFTVLAANTGRTVSVSDTRKEEGYVDDEGRAGKEASPTKLSELAVPVVIDRTVVAVLNVENSLPKAFVDNDQKLLETLATHAASALRRLNEQEVLMTQASILESMVEGVSVCDDKGVIFFTNPAFESMFGYRSGELIGKHVSVLYAYPSEENTIVVNDIIQLLKTKGVWFGEIRNRKKNGTVFITSAHVSALKLLGKEYWISVHEGITERKRIEEALRHRVGELTALTETVLDITGRSNLPELLNRIVERAARLLGAKSGGMYLCDSEKQEVRCVVSYNTSPKIVGTVMKYGEGAAGMVATTGKPLIIDDYRTWPGRAAVYEKDQPFSTVLSAPMTWQGQVTGVIHVLDNKEARHFTQRDLELLTLFANHAAIAVENTRLLERLQRHSPELEHSVDERTRNLQ
jgi:PAS domain S-box-containing protein